MKEDELPVEQIVLPSEQNYSTIEKECLAIKLGVHAFRVHWLGRPFTIFTDHQSLEWLDRLMEYNGRLSRWSPFLQLFSDYSPRKAEGKCRWTKAVLIL